MADNLSPQDQQPQHVQPVVQIVQEAPGTSGMAVSGLVLGIIAALGSFLPIINNASFFLALFGLLFALIGFHGIRKGKKRGKGIAVAGIVLGIVSIAIVLATQSMYSSAWKSAVESTSAPSEQAAAQGATSRYEVTIDGTEVSTSRSGDPVIIVTYTWTNNSDNDSSFMISITDKAFQDGVQLDSSYTTDGVGDDYSKQIRPGTTQTVKRAFKLNSESDVEIEVSQTFDFSGKTLAEGTFSVA